MKIEQSVLDQIRSRPRFKIYSDLTREEYTEYLREFLKKNSTTYSGNINNEAALISVRSEQNYFWQPCLALRTEHDAEENKTVIRGIFGPTSAVWTFFMFLNFIFSILWMVGFTIWYVEEQIKSNDFPWALPFSFIMLSLLGLTFLAARIGKFRAKEEMKQLREFAEESVRQYEEYARRSKEGK